MMQVLVLIGIPSMIAIFLIWMVLQGETGLVSYYMAGTIGLVIGTGLSCFFPRYWPRTTMGTVVLTYMLVTALYLLLG